MNNVKIYRNTKALSIRKLSSMTGVSKTQISKMETSDNFDPKLGTARKLADALETTVDLLFPK